MNKILITACLASLPLLSLAKLPALSDEAKAKAAETAARAAWTSKVDTYQLCKAQDKVAAGYYKNAKAAGKETRPAITAPSCADPGVFAYLPPEAPKPQETAGAHSPTATATSPPNAKQPAAVETPAPAKKP